MSKYIWIGNRRYYWYGTYDNWQEAYNTARYYRRKNKKCRYFIQVSEEGYLFPSKSYKLYLTHIIKLGVFG